MPRFAHIAALTACLVIGANAAQAHDVKVGALEIDHPWSRSTPGGAKVAAGYVTITNTGKTADRLTAVAADSIAGKAELHEASTKDGVMSMKPLPEGLAIPAGGSVVLQPGGGHIMFMDLKHPLKQGDSFPGSLTFEKAGKVDVSFIVEAVGASAPAAGKPADPMGGMDTDHGSMGGMHMDH